MSLFKNHEVDYMHSKNLFKEDRDTIEGIEDRVKILPNMTDTLKSKIEDIDVFKFNSKIPEGWVIWLECDEETMISEIDNNKDEIYNIIRKIIEIMRNNEMEEVAPIGFDPKKGDCITQMR